MYPLVYDRILVNEGNAWNPDTNSVTIPYTGYYLVHYGGGIPNTRMFHELYSSESVVSGLVVNSMENGTDNLGKTVILRFTAGSVLDIKTQNNTFSNVQMQTTFMRLLLYKD